MSLWLGQLGNHASRMTINLIDWTILDTFDYQWYQNALGYGVDIFLLQLGLNRYRRLVFFLWICHLRMQLRGPKEIKYLSEWKVKMPILLGIGFKQRWNKKSSPRLLLVIWSACKHGRSERRTFLWLNTGNCHGASLKSSTSIKFSDSALYFKKATKTSTSVTLSPVLATFPFIF